MMRCGGAQMPGAAWQVFEYADVEVLIAQKSAALFFFLPGCFVAYAQLLGTSNVLSARIENALAVADKASIQVTIKNTGERPITAFSIGFSHLNANGERVPCGGRGADMIDWSDPMPGRGIYIHMRRN